MNAFDFLMVKASAPRVSDLTRAGVPRAKIERRRAGCAVYGQRVFPRWSYVATLAFYELSQSHQADACAAEWRAKGIAAGVSYHCSE